LSTSTTQLEDRRMTTVSSLPLAITMGDAAGIGPEIIVKAFAEQPALTQHCVVVGDVAVMQRACQVLHDKQLLARPLRIQAVVNLETFNSTQRHHTLSNNTQAPTDQHLLPVLQVGTPLRADQLPPWGRISAEAGKMAAESVIWAANAALRREVAALVTAPLHKEALSAAGTPYNQFPGHTELLQFCAAAHARVSVADMPVRMMLANPDLRTVLVSIHVSLRQAIDAVTFDNVLQTLRITHQSETLALGRAPHIAVAGLNPHAGEGGLMGREELDILIPAIAQARAEGLHVSGPYAPDTVFMRARAKNGQAGEFDVVVAMYHDQGLIPVKYLGVEQGVNVTLGLPLVRTSPDHGTAFDLAGTGRADPASLVQALRMAQQLVGANPV
jgi:4-hydroxythreonine-4-phosphate dehydrogenase